MKLNFGSKKVKIQPSKPKQAHKKVSGRPPGLFVGRVIFPSMEAFKEKQRAIQKEGPKAPFQLFDCTQDDITELLAQRKEGGW